jgi:hypothetical protein
VFSSVVTSDPLEVRAWLRGSPACRYSLHLSCVLMRKRLMMLPRQARASNLSFSQVEFVCVLGRTRVRCHGR